jgi:NAD(P)-dependent dehydrogenase (short-subunit alcohol dehydrogenase family)
MSTFEVSEMKVRRPKQVKYDFSGTTVLITGAAHGQGKLHALRFAEAGADVALCDLPDGKLPTVPYPLGSSEKLEAVAEQCRSMGAKAYTAIADVRSEAQVQAFVDGAAKELGKIDVAIANAGIASIVDTVDMPEETWDVLVDINLKGVFLTLKHAGRHMLQQGHGGSLIATGSVHSYTGVPGSAHYVAAKHGVAGLCKSMAIELAPHKIRVNYVCPTALNTPLVELMATDAVPEGHGERIVYATGCCNLLDEGAPLVEAIEVTEAIMYLASDASLYVTGAPLLVDAGFTAK